MYIIIIKCRGDGFMAHLVDVTLHLVVGKCHCFRPGTAS